MGVRMSWLIVGEEAALGLVRLDGLLSRLLKFLCHLGFQDDSGGRFGQIGQKRIIFSRNGVLGEHCQHPIGSPLASRSL